MWAMHFGHFVDEPALFSQLDAYDGPVPLTELRAGFRQIVDAKASGPDAVPIEMLLTVAARSSIRGGLLTPSSFLVAWRVSLRRGGDITPMSAHPPR